MMQKVVKNTVRKFLIVIFGPITMIRRFAGGRLKMLLLLQEHVLIVYEGQDFVQVNVLVTISRKG